ncbi:uncharacterized protein N7515_001035 [Penicillium bovifimosum]|uniref:BZIP domain-containing protein n=1 Tax=Penicillium bovifimosum TaxID=126998 RepID=A0A9W9LC01_9EURO|nr:uncharacterized protein N7515_001035 [Penicillium bovifimosum]KAJ5146471.1 hypothetical protein N7515_001035 [Penicillium bovifimosum]
MQYPPSKETELSKMKEEQSSPEEDILSQTQDPLERRRLQNRLSQRNHRRKIRERIAKLQERVIANELRAAAALNGWDHAYNPSLFPRPHSAQSDNDLSFGSRDMSPLIPDCSSFMPSYPLFPQSWPNDYNTFQQHSSYPGDLPYFSTASEASSVSPVTSGLTQSPTMSPPTTVIEDTYRDKGTSESLIHDSVSTSPHQPLYYVATEAALPQIIQVINAMSPQYKVIVLVPPESPASASAHPFPTPDLLHGAGHTGLEHTPPQQSNPQNMGCLCSQNGYSAQSGHTAPRSWLGVGQCPQVSNPMLA